MRRIAANYLFPITDKPIKNGYVELTDDGTIISIGELDREIESTEFYNGILIPGFTNAHCHIELSHLKDKFMRGTGMSGFINQINSLRESAPRERRVELIGSEMERLYSEGVSAMGDISNSNESFETKAHSPLYTRTFLEVFGSEPNDAEAVMDGVRRLHSEALAWGLDAAPTPHSPYTMSPKLLELSCREALKEGFLSYHNQESSEEEELLISGCGALAENYKGRGLHTPPVTGRPAIFHFLDALQKSHKPPFEENILLIHNTVTTEESIEAALGMLKNCFWVLCPLSNLFIHEMLPPINLLRKKGARIALGTDSLSSNSILSMVEEIKCIEKNFPELSLNEILSWVCMGGAEALGQEQRLGSFEKGKNPGVVLIDNIDWNTFHLTPESSSKRII